METFDDIGKTTQRRNLIKIPSWLSCHVVYHSLKSNTEFSRVNSREPTCGKEHTATQPRTQIRIFDALVDRVATVQNRLQPNWNQIIIRIHFITKKTCDSLPFFIVRSWPNKRDCEWIVAKQN